MLMFMKEVNWAKKKIEEYNELILGHLYSNDHSDSE